MWRKKNTLPLLMGLQAGTTTLEIRKLGMTLQEDRAVTLLGIYPENSLACNKDTCSTMFTGALIIIASSRR